MTERDSTRPIRALHRGLEVLAEVNRLRRAPIHSVAGGVHLSRTTTYRILETLRMAGYIERDPEDDSYRPTITSRTLSEGFDDTAALAHIAWPLLGTLRSQLTWPTAMAIPSGAAMLIREEQHGAGIRVPMLASASGRAYLAHCTAAQREALLELLSRSSLPEDRIARTRVEVERLLRETRSQGFGVAHRALRAPEETSLAVPVRAAARVVAAITLRYAAGALPLRHAIERLVPRMREAAARIESRFDSGEGG